MTRKERLIDEARRSASQALPVPSAVSLSLILDDVIAEQCRTMQAVNPEASDSEIRFLCHLRDRWAWAPERKGTI